jgi:hypothetical protein
MFSLRSVHKSLVCLSMITGIFISFVSAQDGDDSLLFRIKLSDDTNNVYGCRWDDRVRLNLAGPILMQKGSMLFYSQFGYLLYTQDGKLIDSHSVFKLNKPKDAPCLLAYPLDSTTILYYRQKPGKEPEVFEKKLFKNRLMGLTEDDYQIFNEVGRSQLFNIASNSVVDEMGSKQFLLPQLLGYTSITDKGIKWWTIDKLYSFSSPIIAEQDGKYLSFFPGLKADQPCNIKRDLIEPLGVFTSDGRWFYYGLFSSMGNTADEYYQALVLCDQAGNILSSDRLLKQEITDAVLTHVESSNTNYTVRMAGRHVFVPAVDRSGNLYYGIINYEWKKLEVYKRKHMVYVPLATKADLQQKFDNESNMEFSPIKLECNAIAERGVHPEVILKKGKRIDFLDNEQTTLKGFYVLAHRYMDNNLKTKLNRIQSALPEEVQAMQDTIAKKSTAWCPYAISLNRDSTVLAKLYYGYGDVIMCARVIEVTSDKVFVRIDLDSWAEVIVFSTEGKYLSRFIFNRQNFDDRKDLVVVSNAGEIIERNYETDKSGKTYYRWVLQ